MVKSQASMSLRIHVLPICLKGEVIAVRMIPTVVLLLFTLEAGWSTGHNIAVINCAYRHVEEGKVV